MVAGHRSADCAAVPLDRQGTHRPVEKVGMQQRELKKLVCRNRSFILRSACRSTIMRRNDPSLHIQDREIQIIAGMRIRPLEIIPG